MSTEDTPVDGRSDRHKRRDAQVDEEEEESFPASDPHSSWAGRSADPDE